MTQWIPTFVRWESECLPSNIQKSEMKDDYYVFFGEPSFNKNVPIPDDDFFYVMTTFWQQRRRKKEEKIVDGFHGALECQGYMRRDVIWLLLLFANFFVKIQGIEGSKFCCLGTSLVATTTPIENCLALTSTMWHLSLCAKKEPKSVTAKDVTQPQLTNMWRRRHQKHFFPSLPNMRACKITQLYVQIYTWVFQL